VNKILSEKDAKIDDVISSNQEISARTGIKRTFDSAYKRLEKFETSKIKTNKPLLESLIKLRNLINTKIRDFEKKGE
jgi:hypothetical protein